MENVNFAERKLKVSGIKALKAGFCMLFFGVLCYAQDIKQPNVAGSFYPDDAKELSQMVDTFLNNAKPDNIEGDIFALISPHAGYGFSGATAAFGYKLVQNKAYKTVVVIGPSHSFAFNGVSIYPDGVFHTPLGDLKIDNEFTQKLLYKNKDIFFEPAAFEKEHSVEVQLPFLQKVLLNFKIVPIVIGDCSFEACQNLAYLLKDAIGIRKDVLVVASTDMYHGYDYDESDLIDSLTLGYLKNMDAQGVYNGLREGRLQLCGGFPVVATLILANKLGHKKIVLLKHTNSAEVTGKKVKGIWTVGYASLAIDQPKGEAAMLNKKQKERLLQIARSSIQVYLKTGKKLELIETDTVLLKEMGAFVTLHEHGQLRGCIGNLQGQQSLYLTIRDMSIEAAEDPRFRLNPVTLNELKDIDIEISALSPLKRIESVDEIKMGTHGVIVRNGFNSGVFLPQVATETGWTKEEFLSELCSQKAGLSSDAWKDKSTEIYTFTAEVFSEKEI